MPALSPTMTDGIINQWLVKVGDTVKAGDIIAEIETDKATMEVEAVDEGKITHLLEDTVNKQIPVNSVIAIIDGDDKGLKKQFISQIKKDVIEKGFELSIKECSDRLSKDYKVQAFIRDINFFKLSEGRIILG